MQKAIDNAASILSTTTQIEMSTPGAGNALAAVAQLSKAIAEEETSMMDILQNANSLTLMGFHTCRLSVPATVRVSLQMRMTSPILGGQSLLLTTDVTMRYAGNNSFSRDCFRLRKSDWRSCGRVRHSCDNFFTLFFGV